MKGAIEAAIAAAVKDLYNTEVVVLLTRPEEQFGDYATNVALQLAGPANKNPREIAEQLAEKLKVTLAKQVADISVAGPGFLNITLSSNGLREALTTKPNTSLAGKEVVAEYSDPNPFKVLHAGHLYTSIVGDGVANLLEQAGANVHRVNFGGDVGLHIAKSMWAILNELDGEHPEKLASIKESERSEWMANCYIAGTAAYEDDEQAKAKIIELNKRIYQLQADDDHESALAQIYWTCRQWSYDYFNTFYARIGTVFEKYYPESSVAELGLKTVKEQLKNGVFKESEGAIIFDGEVYDLHTRVFINSEGIPTYEAKDIGLILQKWADYHFDKSVIITGNEQEQYMAVVQKALEQFRPELVKRSSHLTHGMVKLKGGVKMSSRKGNILRAVDILNLAATANKQLTGQDNDQIVLGAVKYAFLKNRMGGDIIYDPEESVSLVGNSGPYLQYAHARARSILQKAARKDQSTPNDELEKDERSLARKVSEYPEVIDKASAELMPHHICTYLYELAQNFNSFYEHNRVIGDPREAVRLWLVSSYADTLKKGLGVLGIVAPERL